MKDTFLRIAALLMFIMFASPALAHAGSPDSRTIEFPFKLSGDLRSEFRAKAQVVSAGTIVIQARWTPLEEGAALERPLRLSVISLRPDGIEASRQTGTSPLRLEYRVTDGDIDSFAGGSQSMWAVKLINEGAGEGLDVGGKLRLTVPLTNRLMVNTQFTLLSVGNAQEMGFAVNTPGRLVLEANWQPDPLSGHSSAEAALTLQLIHTDPDKIHARRRGFNSLRIEQQVTEREIDRGLRWTARIQNEGQAKIKGLLKVTFTPSL